MTPYFKGEKCSEAHHVLVLVFVEFRGVQLFFILKFKARFMIHVSF